MENNWTRVDIFTTSQGLEPLGAQLMEIGFPSFAIRDAADFESFLEGKSGNWDYIDDSLMKLRDAETAVTVYLPDNRQGRDGLSSIREMLARLKAMDGDDEWGRLEYELSGVREEDWANAWKRYYKPLKIGKKLVVHPSWEEYLPTPGEVVLRLDPGMAFGSGTHESTRLCLELLEDALNGGEEVLDIGCGSGILSIAALLLGAKRAVGVDIDQVAVRVAKENAALNGVDAKAEYLCGDLAEQVTGAYDIVCANIVADVIMRFAPLVPDYLRENGLFLASGIIGARAEEVRNSIAGHGFRLKKSAESGGWAAMLFQYGRESR